MRNVLRSEILFNKILSNIRKLTFPSFEFCLRKVGSSYLTVYFYILNIPTRKHVGQKSKYLEGEKGKKAFI